MKIVFFDVETSGLDAEHHEIIQIAAVATENWEVRAQFEAKLDFDMAHASPEALEMNCYDKDVWLKEADHPGNVLNRFAQWLRPWADVQRVSKKSGKPFQTVRMGGHNLAFDMEFLRAAFRHHGAFCPADFLFLDTLQLALWRDHRDHLGFADYKLETLAAHLGVPIEGAHDALADITANVQVARLLLNLPTPTQPQE